MDGKPIFEVPGNLVFFHGAVISQGIDKIVAYPQLQTKLAEIDEKIEATPNSPEVLTERGDLRLDRGDLQGAVEDLSAALKNQPAARPQGQGGGPSCLRR